MGQDKPNLQVLDWNLLVIDFQILREINRLWWRVVSLSPNVLDGNVVIIIVEIRHLYLVQPICQNHQFIFNRILW